MISWYCRIVPVAIVLVVGGTGCASFSNMGGSCEGPRQCDTANGCQSENCNSQDCNSGNCHSHDRWRDRWSDEWWAIEADSPVGARQKYKKGKVWPPKPRPTGKQQQLSHRYHNAHYWPLPYVCQDRDYVRSVTQMQADNGWRDATTLYHYHFDEVTNELNHAGKMHLQWVLIDVPHSHRVAWVQTAETPDISQVRLSSVQSETIRLTGNETTLPIMLRPTLATGRPAIEITTIRRAELSSIPAPRISYSPTSSSSASP